MEESNAPGPDKFIANWALVIMCASVVGYLGWFVWRDWVNEKDTHSTLSALADAVKNTKHEVLVALAPMVPDDSESL